MTEPYSYADVNRGDTVQWITPSRAMVQGVVDEKQRRVRPPQQETRERLYSAEGLLLYDSRVGGAVSILRRKDIDEPQEIGAVVEVYNPNYASQVQYLRITAGPKGWLQLPPSGGLLSFEQLGKLSSEPIKRVE